MEEQVGRRAEPGADGDMSSDGEAGYMGREDISTPRVHQTRGRTRRAGQGGTDLPLEAAARRNVDGGHYQEPPRPDPMFLLIQQMVNQQQQRDRDLRQDKIDSRERDDRLRADAARKAEEDAALLMRQLDQRDRDAAAASQAHTDQLAGVLARLPAAPAVVVRGAEVDEDRAAERLAEREAVRVQKAVQALPRWKDGDDVPTFFRRLETLMEVDRIPEDQWVVCVTRVMDGKIAAYIGGTIPAEALLDYQTLKESILTYMGLTVDHYSKVVFGQSWVQGLSESEIFDRSLQGVRKLMGGGTLAEREFHLAKAVVLDKLQPEVASYVNRDPPMNGHQLVQKLREYRNLNASFYKRQQRVAPPDQSRYSRTTPAPWKSQSVKTEGQGGSSSGASQQPQGSPNRQGSGNTQPRFHGHCHNCDGYGHRAYECTRPRKVKKETVRCIQKVPSQPTQRKH